MLTTSLEPLLQLPITNESGTHLRVQKYSMLTSTSETVQFPVFQGERVNCEDNTSLGEFTLAPIPPMRAGEAVLEVVFEVDVNGILKVTATEKTSGRSANITISNSVGKLSAGEIEKMVSDAEKFKTSDDAFSKRFESRQQLEAYISRVEEMISGPSTLKQNQRKKIEDALSDAMAQLEQEDANAEDLRKKVRLFCQRLRENDVLTFPRNSPSSALSPRPSPPARRLTRYGGNSSRPKSSWEYSSRHGETAVF